MTATDRTSLPPPSAPAVSRRTLLRAGIGVVGVGGVVGTGTITYALAEAARDLKVTSYRLTPPRWPAGRQLTIGVVADLHAGGPNMGLERIAAVIDTANALKPDLMVVLGDYFATHRFVTEVVPHDAWAAEIGRLKAPLGVYSILGNHDWWHDVAGTRRALGRAQVPVLENDAVQLGPTGQRFWLVGLGDQLAHWLGPSRFRGVDDLPGALARVTSDDPVLLLAHEPDIFPKVPDRVSLTLAGHTHGGQVRLPLIPPVWSPSPLRYVYGHVVENGRHMIVSGGLGCSNAPIRLGMPPEILHVTVG